MYGRHTRENVARSEFNWFVPESAATSINLGISAMEIQSRKLGTVVILDGFLPSVLTSVGELQRTAALNEYIIADRQHYVGIGTKLLPTYGAELDHLVIEKKQLEVRLGEVEKTLDLTSEASGISCL
jgi:hypothetical protein